jgi:hypothetical protein
MPRLRSFDTAPLPISQLDGTHGRAIIEQMTRKGFGLLVSWEDNVQVIC